MGQIDRQRSGEYAGHKDQVVGRIQERYGIRKEQAEQQVDGWNRTLGQENEMQREGRARKAS
jgi:uncharacterized protein YjbJ (UPF0337 family)